MIERELLERALQSLMESREDTAELMNSFDPLKGWKRYDDMITMYETQLERTDQLISDIKLYLVNK